MQIVYAKYNRHRLPAFQVETCMGRDAGRWVVSKRALTPAAVSHIADIRRGYDALREALVGEPFALPAQIGAPADTFRVDCAPGISLGHQWFQALRTRDRSRFLGQVDVYARILSAAFSTGPALGAPTEWEARLGIDRAHPDLAGLPWLPLIPVDVVAGNILCHENRYYLIDTEWVFVGCAPLAFVLYRSLFHFHRVQYASFGTEAFIPFDELLQHVKITSRLKDHFDRIEERFQAHVFGAVRSFRRDQRYLQFAHESVDSLQRLIEHQRAVIRENEGSVSAYADLVEAQRRQADETRRLLEEKDRWIRDTMNSRSWKLLHRMSGWVDALRG